MLKFLNYLKTNWKWIIALLSIITLVVLLYVEKISTEDFLRIATFFFSLTAAVLNPGFFFILLTIILLDCTPKKESLEDRLKRQLNERYHDQDVQIIDHVDTMSRSELDSLLADPEFRALHEKYSKPSE